MDDLGLRTVPYRKYPPYKILIPDLRNQNTGFGCHIFKFGHFPRALWTQSCQMAKQWQFAPKCGQISKSLPVFVTRNATRKSKPYFSVPCHIESPLPSVFFKTKREVSRESLRLIFVSLNDFEPSQITHFQKHP